MPDSGYDNLQRVGDPVMNSSSDEELVDKAHQLEQPVRALIGEGHWFLDHQSWLEAAAARRRRAAGSSANLALSRQTGANPTLLGPLDFRVSATRCDDLVSHCGFAVLNARLGIAV